ncbi:DUF1194 domain-containing protein [Dinoroseobacter sp. S375]|uniref:DUF1194 domain-containing protein n=1 Tax=Dinoroseobacter sp. S375 TaxID=3415136 RepID=UPI003C7CEF1D
MRWLIPVCLALWSTLSPTLPSAEEIEVDVELLMAVDVSRSMSPAELEIQRRGYAEALRSDEVIAALQSGLLGQVALSYVEWAGAGAQRIVVDWTLIEDRAGAEAFAAQLSANYNPALRRTSISSALSFGWESLRDNAFAGLRRVIDISGDGPNNHGGLVTYARDRAVADGIVINGLPLMTEEVPRSPWHLDNLDVYYRTCVIGGPGSFVIPVTDWAQFADAVRRKLVLELVGLTPGPDAAPRPRPVQYIPGPDDATDCQIGEKIWQRNRGYWGAP